MSNSSEQLNKDPNLITNTLATFMKNNPDKLSQTGELIALLSSKGINITADQLIKEVEKLKVALGMIDTPKTTEARVAVENNDKNKEHKEHKEHDINPTNKSSGNIESTTISPTLESILRSGGKSPLAAAPQSQEGNGHGR
jgi:hypothetical protein